MLDLLCNVLPG